MFTILSITIKRRKIMYYRNNVILVLTNAYIYVLYFTYNAKTCHSVLLNMKLWQVKG